MILAFALGWMIYAASAWASIDLSDENLSSLGPCHTRCYKEKSAAYQRCRRIPPMQRGKRSACFREADDALTQCIANCH